MKSCSASSSSGTTADEVVAKTISEEQKSDVKDLLMKCRDGLWTCMRTSLFGVDKVTGFTETVIEQIISKCDTFSNVQDVYKNVDLWCEDHAIAVYNIITSVRNDNK